ncbi:acyl-CoA thioesterase domain-containing protein [Streptomyces sp. NPDC006422]|uniref:acyl-CoA thioesterase n=1 Tax=unclassified Streptomyces TaxID=2593676 RepID=UPI0033B0BB3F
MSGGTVHEAIPRETGAPPQPRYGVLGQGRHVRVDVTPDGGAYQGHCHAGRAAARSYGGAVLAQALDAAHRSVGDDRVVHSLHAYFLRALSPERPVRFTPDVVRDGRSYSMRQVTAEQDGKEALTMSVSFKQPQQGGRWRQPGMPDVPGPERLRNGWAHRPQNHPLRTSVEYREVPMERRPDGVRADATPADGGRIDRYGWMRTVGAMPDDPGLHAGVLAYMCDAPLAPTALVAYGEPRPRGIALASLDHAMWFHRPARVDEWLLFACHSVAAGDGRTFAQGEFWSERGELVASVTQEALLHVPRPR